MRSSRGQLIKIVVWQLVVTAALAGLVWLQAPAAAASTLAGGLVFVAANGYGLLRPMSQLGSDDAVEFCALFIKGQMGKLMLATAGFALVFGAPWAAQTPAPVFGAFVVMALLNVAQTSQLSRTLDGTKISN